MRFKFRAWNIDDEVMNSDLSLDEVYFYIDDGDVLTEREGTVIMQWTGMEDKNGKEIYEGDVLLFNNSINDMNRKWKCVVKYREGSFVCVYPNDNVYNHFDSWNVPKVTWEVIGNIYENPELLEGSK